MPLRVPLITPGRAGLFLVILMNLKGPEPQALFAVTLSESLAMKLGVKFTVIVVVPCPDVMDPPGGAVQVYDVAPATAGIE